MSKQASNRKPLIVGIFAAVVILAALLVVLLTQCTPGGSGSASTADTTAPVQLQNVRFSDLYWNVARAQYDGKSEGGMSSRRAESDGYFRVRFFNDGKMVELKAENRSVVNKIEVKDLMGLVFDDDGIVVDVIAIEDMPVEKVGWKFYVQSTGGQAYIYGGTAKGKAAGAVYVVGTASMTMENGSVSGGTALNGGNIASRGELVIKNGTTSGGTATASSTSSNNNFGGGYLSGDTGETITDRANIALWNASSLTLTDVELPAGIMVTNSGKNPKVYLSGKVVVGGQDKGLKLASGDKNLYALSTIEIGTVGISEDSSIDLTVNQKLVGDALVSGLTKEQRDAINEKNNFKFFYHGYKISEKENTDGTFDLILAAE